MDTTRRDSLPLCVWGWYVDHFGFEGAELEYLPVKKRSFNFFRALRTTSHFLRIEALSIQLTLKSPLACLFNQDCSHLQTIKWMHAHFHFQHSTLFYERKRTYASPWGVRYNHWQMLKSLFPSPFSLSPPLLPRLKESIHLMSLKRAEHAGCRSERYKTPPPEPMTE